MTTYAFPSIAPNACLIRPIPNTRTFVAPATRATQTSGRGGATIQVELSFSNLQDDDRRELLGFLGLLNGQEHRFTIHDYGHVQGGTLAGTPLVRGASQTGFSIDLDGWTPSSAVLKRGDQISIDSYLYIVTSDATADGSGITNGVGIFPKIRGAGHADNAAVDTSSPVGTFMLAGSPVAVQSRPGIFSDLKIVGVQDVLAA